MSGGTFGTNWLDLSSTSNRYTRTYIQGFMDISGGNLIVRQNNLYLTQGDASINGNLILGYDASINRRLFVGSDVSFGGNLYINGNVGIGTTTPSYKLDVSGIVRSTGNIIANASTVSTSTSTGALQVTGGVGIAGNLNVGSDASFNGTINIKGTNVIHFGSDQTKESNAGKIGYGTFTTTALNIVGAGTSNGSRYVQIYDYLTVVSTVTANSFNATSDYRIKSDIQILDGSYNVDCLNPVTYINKGLNKRDIGFIAHEIQEHYPFLVSGEKDDEKLQTLNYIGLIGILTKEIQDLKRENKKILERLEKAGI